MVETSGNPQQASLKASLDTSADRAAVQAGGGLKHAMQNTAQAFNEHGRTDRPANAPGNGHVGGARDGAAQSNVTDREEG